MKSILSALLAGSALVSAVPSRRGTKVQYAGVNIAGFDFGCDTSGNCNLAYTTNPLTSSNAAGQMDHFSKDDGLNIFRLPVGWQFLTNNNYGNGLDANNFAAYDALVQACINSGAAKCIIDIHNYARWNGQIIGQGGPSDDDFAKTWSQIAAKYATTSQVIFGTMNEPHDLDINTWAATVQKVVTAIRAAGATEQLILLPGTEYTSAGAFVSDGSAAALAGIKDADGSNDKLIFDVHQYLDSDNSGTHTECDHNNVAGFSGLADWLRSNKRQALNTETGGGNTQSCVTNLCEQIQYLNQNADVFLGYVGWAAGAFGSTYELLETPTQNGGSWTDQLLVTNCIVGAWVAS